MKTEAVAGHPCHRNCHFRCRYCHPVIVVGDVAGAVVVDRLSHYRHLRRHGRGADDGGGRDSGGGADDAGIAWGLCTLRPRRPPLATR